MERLLMLSHSTKKKKTMYLSVFYTAKLTCKLRIVCCYQNIAYSCPISGLLDS